MRLLSVILFSTTLAAFAAGCGSDTDPDLSGSESASELVTASTSGAVNSSVSGGTFAMQESRGQSVLASMKSAFLPDALAAAVQCPTATGNAGGCSVAGSVMTLTYSSCSFQPANANSFTWTGGQVLTLSSGTPSCGTFPSGSAGVALARTFLANTARTSPDGSHVIAFDSATASGYATPVSGGSTLKFGGAGTHNLIINGVHITATKTGTSKKGKSVTKTTWDHTIDTPDTTNGLTVAVSGATRTVNGSVRLQHNLAKFTATATLTNVVYSAGCCHPTSGSISTAYSGSKTGTETLTFNTTCGSATLVGTDSTSSPITLTHCL